MKETKENSELKNVEVDVVTNFIKDEIRKVFLMILVMTLIMMMKSLDSDKICVTSNRILVVCNGAFWHTYWSY